MNPSPNLPSSYRWLWYALCAAAYAGPPILAIFVMLWLLSWTLLMLVSGVCRMAVSVNTGSRPAPAARVGAGL